MIGATGVERLRTLVAPIAHRMGVHRRLADGLRLATSKYERARWQVIARDAARSHGELVQISSGAPTGKTGQTALMVSSFPTVWGAKLEGVLALAARTAGYAPVVAELGAPSWTRRYHRALGIQQFASLGRFHADFAGQRLHSDLEAFVSRPFLVSDLMRLKHRGVDVGRIVLSNVLYRQKFRKLDIESPETRLEVRRQLLAVQRNVRAAEALILQVRPEIAFVLEKGLSPAAELVNVCLLGGVPVVQYVGTQHPNDYALKRFSRETRHQHPFSLHAETWERAKAMPWTAEQERSLLSEFAEGYESGTWFSRKFTSQGKAIKPPVEVRQQLGLDPRKKTAVIFSHVLWDATFFYGEGLFEDYESWLLETVRAACTNPRLNWVVKLHPDLVWKLKYENYTGELRDTLAIRSAVGTLPEHVKLVMPETDISTYSFYGITDYCLTVRGTIGIEMAAHGVPVITAGTGRYSGLGFTVDSASRTEYLARLAALEEQPPMSAHEVELARRYAYALFKCRPWPLRSFETVRADGLEAGHPLETNLEPRVGSFAEFAAAPDVRSFTAWLESGQADYWHEGQEGD